MLENNGITVILKTAEKQQTGKVPSPEDTGIIFKVHGYFTG
jgi:hypothetical protein